MRLWTLGRVELVNQCKVAHGQLLYADQRTTSAGLVDAQLCRALF